MKRKLFFASVSILGLIGLVVGCGTGLFEGQIPTSVVMSFVPASGDVEVELNKAIVITTSALLDPGTINSGTIPVVADDGTAIDGTYSYDSTAGTITFTPTSGYPQGAVITVTVTGGVGLLTGGSAAVQSASFTTLSYSNLYAQWKFDGNGADATGNGNTLTEHVITYDTSSHYQGTGAAIFNGTTSYFSTTGNVDLGDKFTVTVWIKLPNPVKASCNGILTNTIAGVNTNGFKLFVNTFGTSDLTINSEAGDGTNGALLSTQTSFVTVDSWKHLAFVVDKTAASGQRALFYFNGVKADQTVAATTGSATAFPSVFDSNAPIYIGAFIGTSLHFKGEIDDVRIYKDTLTAAKILQISQQH